jgi:predicted NBD/HSP70 family sugar kinase
VTSRGIGHAHALFELADVGGDADAETFANLLADDLGTALGSAVNLFDVELIVIGGGIAPGFLARAERLRRAMGQALFAREVSTVRIVPAAAGALAGAVGAARLAMRAV